MGQLPDIDRVSQWNNESNVLVAGLMDCMESLGVHELFSTYAAQLNQTQPSNINISEITAGLFHDLFEVRDVAVTFTRREDEIPDTPEVRAVAGWAFVARTPEPAIDPASIYGHSPYRPDGAIFYALGYAIGCKDKPVEFSRLYFGPDLFDADRSEGRDDATLYDGLTNFGFGPAELLNDLRTAELELSRRHAIDDDGTYNDRSLSESSLPFLTVAEKCQADLEAGRFRLQGSEAVNLVTTLLRLNGSPASADTYSYGDFSLPLLPEVQDQVLPTMVEVQFIEFLDEQGVLEAIKLQLANELL